MRLDLAQMRNQNDSRDGGLKDVGTKDKAHRFWSWWADLFSKADAQLPEVNAVVSIRCRWFAKTSELY